MAKMVLKPPARRGDRGATVVYAYDLSRYLTGKVDVTAARYDTQPHVVPIDGKFQFYFLAPGSTSGLEVAWSGSGDSDYVDVARFITVASAAP